jgi:hypothetical protein
LPDKLPLAAQPFLINTILSGPHAFLFANEATSVTIPIPWYCNTDLATLDMEENPYIPSADITVRNGNYATLVFYVMQPLMPSDGSSDSLSIVVEACFSDLEMYVPTPRYVKYTPQAGMISSVIDSGTKYAKKVAGDLIDSMRMAVLEYTGLHNPNKPTLENAHFVSTHNRHNIVDDKQHFEKLDPYYLSHRLVNQPIFNTLSDEMSISHICSKKQYIGSFTVKTDDKVGTLLWVRPISPYQGGCSLTVSQDDTICNNIELLHLLTRAWKGTIKIHIQSVMNNKQQVKLRLLQMYNPSVQSLQGYPSYSDILQAPSHLMEFTAGGQEQVIELPYLCRNNLTYNSRDLNTEALFHGLYYMYVAQPLANSDGSPNQIYFNVYISLADDFAFYGYSTELGQSRGPVLFAPQSLTVMNAPQTQQNATINKPSLDFDDSRLTPLYDIRPLIRRVVPGDSKSPVDIPANKNSVIVLPLMNLIGEGSLPSTLPYQHLSRMFYGKLPGLKLRITVNQRVLTSNNHLLKLFIRYCPPSLSIDPLNNLFVSCRPLPDSILFDSNSSFSTPVPYIDIPVVCDTHGNIVYECEIPCITAYKYVGGSNKLSYNYFASSIADEQSTEDLGSLALCFLNTDSNTPASFFYTIHTAFTDETRCGFHCIAPIIQRPVVDQTQPEKQFLTINNTTATITDLPTPPLIKPNKYLYYQRS